MYNTFEEALQQFKCQANTRVSDEEVKMEFSAILHNFGDNAQNVEELLTILIRADGRHNLYRELSSLRNRRSRL